MSKKGGWILASLIIAIFAISFLVSAQGTPVPSLTDAAIGFWQGIVKVLNAVIGPILGDAGVLTISGQPVTVNGQPLVAGDVLFLRALLFGLVTVMVWSTISFVPFLGGKKWVSGIVSVAVGILSIRFLSSDWIIAILLPYNSLGVALTAFLPMIIYFFFLEKGLEGSQYRMLRKTGWILGLVVFLGMYFSRYTTLGEAAWIYLVAAILCLAMFLWDKSIQRIMAESRSDNIQAIGEAETKADVQRQINLLRMDAYGGTGHPSIYVIRPDGKIDDVNYRTRRNALLGMATLHGLKRQVDSLPEPFP